MDQSDKFEFFKWKCPDCSAACRIVNLGDEFKAEVEQLDEQIMLDPVELDILSTLMEERQPMKASEISTLLDITYQLVGKRTEKLRDMDLVLKDRFEGSTKNLITDKALSIYFGESGWNSEDACDGVS